MITLWELGHVSLVTVGIRETVFKYVMVNFHPHTQSYQPLSLTKPWLGRAAAIKLDIKPKDVAIGLTLIPHLFDEHHEQHVHEFLDRFVVTIIDDLLVYSLSEEDHKQLLRMILDNFKNPSYMPSSRSMIFG